jgi:hypothetical protein
MKKRIVSFALYFTFLALPASAAIQQVQSGANWSCSGSGSQVTCQVPLNTQSTTTHNLLAVWTFWQSIFPYAIGTNGVQDSPGNTFYTAVGPTLQSVSNTSAQVFYAKNITGTTPPAKDTITVTYTCPSSCTNPSISSAGAVVVEYSGLDQYYPLDSVSAGYSYTAGSLLDSGTVAPANANLLAFGGGNSSATGLLQPGGGFTNVQSSPTGSSITEQMIVSTSGTLPQGNNTLQRATAGSVCPGTTAPTGDWLMQMAVFKAAK